MVSRNIFCRRVKLQYNEIRGFLVRFWRFLKVLEIAEYFEFKALVLYYKYTMNGNSSLTPLMLV